MSNPRQHPLWGGVTPRLMVLLVGALVLSLLPAVTPPARAAGTTESHPFSHPVWTPIRAESRIGCVNTNCPDHSGGKGWHNYWAIDYYYPHDLPAKPARVGDPVFAAGAGRFHVGGEVPSDDTDAYGCFDAGSRGTEGNWVWIDHGGGIVTRYHHLHDIANLTDGQLVTPDTQIGTRGVSGRVNGAKPCTSVVYLHFEVRKNASFTPTGLNGTRINPGNMFACVGGTKQQYPRDLAPVGQTWTNWDQIEAHKTEIPANTADCIRDVPRTAHRPSWTAVRFGDEFATVRWPDAEAVSPRVTSVIVSVEKHHQSIGYNRAVFRTLRASANATRFSLDNGHKYRIKVAYRNREGYSDWGPVRVGTPAGRPFPPRYRAPGISSGKHSVRLYWKHSIADGTPVTGYIVAFRRYVRGSWGRWSTKRIAVDNLSHGWAGLPSRRYFQAKVRGTSRAGASGWSKTYRVRTKA